LATNMVYYNIRVNTLSEHSAVSRSN